MEQRTEEWFNDRCGYITASKFKDAVSITKSGESALRKNYKQNVAIERLTNQAIISSIDSVALKWGRENELLAKECYEQEKYKIIVDCGFIKHKEKRIGASPDGLIDEDGGIEIKCPFNQSNHIDAIVNGVPSQHKYQIQGCMYITGRKYWDFVSYDPRMPDEYKIYIERIVRDDVFIDKLEQQLMIFDSEVDILSEKIKQNMIDVRGFINEN